MEKANVMQAMKRKQMENDARDKNNRINAKILDMAQRSIEPGDDHRKKLVNFVDYISPLLKHYSVSLLMLIIVERIIQREWGDL